MKEINAFIDLIRKMKSLACSIYKVTCKTESKQQTSSCCLFIQVGWFIVIFRDSCLRHSWVYCMPLTLAFSTFQFSQHALSTYSIQVMCNKKRIILVYNNTAYFFLQWKPPVQVCFVTEILKLRKLNVIISYLTQFNRK